MKMKDRIEKLIKTIILIVIILLGISLMVVPNIYAKVISGSGVGTGFSVELFKEDIPLFNNDYVPVHPLDAQNITFWCAQKGKATYSLISDGKGASQALYQAYKNQDRALTTYSESNPYAYYNRGNGEGLWPSHRGAYNNLVARNNERNCGCGGASVSAYQGDNQTTIDQLNDNLPGIGKPKVQSLLYKYIKQYDITENQAAAYILTAMRRYNSAASMPKDDTVTDEEKEKGYFTIAEKQRALWRISGINTGEIIQSGDRNLGDIAGEYKKFYDKIHSNTNGYEDLVQAHSVNKKGEAETEAGGKYIEETEEFEGYKTYKYKNTTVGVDALRGCYVLGPYCIDYTFNDDTIDTYRSTDTNQVKFNAIENITVYNQDKKDIVKELGGSFKIAYSYDYSNNANLEKNGIKEEGKTRRISDYQQPGDYEMADGSEISGFDSRRPFYIVVYRGTMKPEDFTGFYAKIDFQYLDKVEASMYEFEGNVVEYGYQRTLGSTHTFNYHCTWRTEYSSEPSGDPPTSSTEHADHSSTESIETQTFKYSLKRTVTTTKPQTLLGYKHDGKRHYKTYSVVLTSDFQEKSPKIELYKLSDTTPDSRYLYGAEFHVKLEINGDDAYENEINKKQIEFNRTTNIRGAFKITSSDIKAKGVHLGSFTGKIMVTFTEITPPANHIIKNKESAMEITLEDGEITDVIKKGNQDGVFAVKNSEKNSAIITVVNEMRKDTPKIQIAKINSNNSLLEEAVFDIQVAYTDPTGVKYGTDRQVEYGKLIDEEFNTIKGQTYKGYLNLTKEDFENMPRGFDIESYTGRITLNIKEIGVTASGYRITTKTLRTTLTYENGKLKEYSEDTSAEVLIHYLYDKPLANIYKWYKEGDKLDPAVKDMLEKWIEEQRKDREEKLSYDDVLEWLIEYIEKIGANNETNEEWKTSTLSNQFSSDKNVVQIVVEDTPGEYEWPDIPDVPGPNPLFMRLAGTVFLDQTIVKNGIESNGRLDVSQNKGEGEKGISGVEVALYDAGTNNLAKLVLGDDEKKMTNPTITDEEGRYEFRGVDALNKDGYYIIFRYNGMEYRATDSGDPAEYNSSDWAVTSKGSETNATSVRNNYKEITGATNAYDYSELAGVYEEITWRTRKYINDNEAYPSWEEIKNEIMSHNEVKDTEGKVIGYIDPEIKNKLNYINNIKVEARAGYSSTTPNGTYPYKSTDGGYLGNDNTINESSQEPNLNMLYPGQTQIHLGLVPRDSTDLELRLGTANTIVSINKKDTVYDYNSKLTANHQYIYPEDYNYSTEFNGEGVAYYTEDNIHFYITYEIEIKNVTLTDTSVRQVVDYYNKNFNWKPVYTTTKGNTIQGVEAWYNGDGIDIKVADAPNENIPDGWNKKAYESKVKNTDYNAKYITFENDNYLRAANGDNPQDKLVIHMTYELVGGTSGDAANAKQVLYDNLFTADNTLGLSRSWDIAHYSEINAYYTPGAYLDADSRPGNFVIAAYETALDEYTKAVAEYKKNPTEANDLAVTNKLANLIRAREDDAKKTTMTLTNHAIARTISGQVAEFVNDRVKSSLDLQSEYDDGQRYVTYNDEYIKANNLALKGITVELVELIDDEKEMENGANQIVRAVTKTDENGKYTFSSYIPGNYTVRFVYGDYAGGDNKTLYSKISKNTYKDQDKADYLPINGQYYQSTKANPTTDNNQYWYYTNAEYKADITEESVTEERYSDAYDDAFSRMTQMSSKIEGAEDSTSTVYDYDGVIKVEKTDHTDPIYAYTSTMELEVEYVRQSAKGNKNNEWYNYSIDNVDFGLTPRAYNDMTIGRHVSNIKLYIEGSTLNDEDLVIIDASFDENGNVTEYSVGSDQVMDVLDDSWNLDGVINIFYEQIVQQRAHLEITYTIDIKNDSLYDEQGKVYDTIQYIVDNNGKVVSVVYYGENMDKLTAYETLENNTKAIVYHNSMTDAGCDKNLNKENRNQDSTNGKLENARLGEYSISTGYSATDRKIITSKAMNIVDYPNEPLDFIQKNYKDENVNSNWISTEPKEFVSSRENYNSENGEITLNKDLTEGKISLNEASTVGKETGLLTQSHIIKAGEGSPLLDTLKPGEKRTDTLILQHTLSTSVVDITGDSKSTDLTALDEEYSNLIEITRLANSAGKVVDIEGYDITGGKDAETSRVRNITDYVDKTNTFESEGVTLTPTISTGKSETAVITDPAGLSKKDNVIAAFTGITLISLVILAGGIVMIKKYVIVSK